MATDIELFCTSCATCQTNKSSTQKPQGLLHSLPILERSWQSIGMDFMGPLPKSDGHDYLLVVIDRLTSQVHLIPTDTWVTAKGIAWLFLKEVVRLHGIPDSIMSDWDSKFTLIFWCELLRIMDIKPLMSIAFHPQMDGSTEQVNRSIGQILQTVVRDDQKDWVHKGPMVEFAMNSNVSSTTGFVFWNPWNYWCLECTCNHQRVLTVMSQMRRDTKPLLQHNSGNNLIFVPWLRSVEAVYVDGLQESNTFFSSKQMDNSTKVCVEHRLEFKYSKGMECT